jgi:hypothetical protein
LRGIELLHQAIQLVPIRAAENASVGDDANQFNRRFAASLAAFVFVGFGAA